MTQVERPRLKAGVRWGRVYGWDVLDHASWMAGDPVVVPNDYVGQTRQKGRGRENQHRDDKPWSDLTVGSPRVLWEGWCTDGELDEMERRFIQDVPLERRPRLNWMLNEDNPRQIPIPRQKEQRWARDDRRNDQHWSPTPYRPEVYGYKPAPAVAQRKPAQPWTRGQKHALGWAVTWAVLTLAGWIALVANHAGGWKQTGAAAVFLFTAVVGWMARWVWLGCPLSGRQWRRAARKLRAAKTRRRSR